MIINHLKKIKLIWMWIIAAPFFIWALLFWNLSSQLKFYLLVIMTLFYLITALLYHYQDKSLVFEIVIEYVLIAILSLIILQNLLL